MTKRVVFFEDQQPGQLPFAQALSAQGFEVIQVFNTKDCESEFTHSDFEVLVCSVQTKAAWQNCQKLIARYLHVPVLYVFGADDTREDEVVRDDLHQMVKINCTDEKFLESVDLLSRIGRLHRRIDELSQLASGSTAVDQMFVKLDVHHILDRMLTYFGARIDVQNLYWLRWSSLQHMLQTEPNALVLEMDVVEARSPRVMALNNNDMPHLINLLTKSLTVHELPERSQETHWFKAVEKTNLMYVVVKSLNGGAPMGVLLFEGIDTLEQDTLAPQISETLRLMARFVEFGLSHWDSKKMAMIDDLTELYNQRFLPTVLDNEINRAERRGSAFTVMFLDLDYFKQVNDTKGHWIGSKLLKQVGEILKSTIRSCDYGFRYGGDEFVVILPDTDIHGGQIVAERIRKVIETTQFVIDGHEMRLTVSVGLAGYPHHAITREEIIQLADQAMYYGKRKSRNIVYVAS